MSDESRAAFTAALAEVGAAVSWVGERWQVDFDTDPALCHRASNLVAPLLGEPKLSYDEWAATMLAACGDDAWELRKQTAWLPGRPYPHRYG